MDRRPRRSIFRLRDRAEPYKEGEHAAPRFKVRRPNPAKSKKLGKAARTEERSTREWKQRNGERV